MNRSVRNGIAIAGMTGGLWFLGHAVANADTGQTATADNTSTASSTGSGSSSNDSTNVAKSSNDNATVVSTGTISGGNGGTNTATINTGAEPPPMVATGGPGTASANSAPSGGGGGGGGGTSVSVTTGDVSLTQEANGGSVSGSGNVKVDTSTDQSASASNDVSQSSSGSSHEGDKGGGQEAVSSNSVPNDGRDSHGGGNDSTNIAKAENENATVVRTGDIYGGTGGLNFADVNTGLIIGFPETVWTPSVSGMDEINRDRHGNIHIRATTGAVYVRQEANGGDVTGSGNVDVNASTHQSASASNDVTQTSTSADRRKHHDGEWSGDQQNSVSSNSESDGREHHRGGNDSTNVAVARNHNFTGVFTGDIYGGDGGLNVAEINTGLIVEPILYGPPPILEASPSVQTDGEEHHHHRSIDVTVSTGDVSLTQEANGGDVTGSGNVSVCTSTDQSASASNDVTQTSSSEGRHSRSDNDSRNIAIARNHNATVVRTGDIYGGNGGENDASINTGAVVFFSPVMGFDNVSANSTDGEEHHHRSIDVTVSTGDVSATQEANGGDVTGSGNVSVNASTDQSASASNDVTQTSSSEGRHSRSDNDSRNIAVSRNHNFTGVFTGDIYGGDGGLNFAEINTGLITDGYFGGHFPDSLDVTTGDVTLVQEANGGDVTGSGNVAVGKGNNCACHKASPPPTTPSTPVTAPVAVVTTTTTTAAATVLSSAQPTSTLATTGADTSAPLTAGLLALGAGAALTLAGRRRRELQDA